MVGLNAEKISMGEKHNLCNKGNSMAEVLKDSQGPTQPNGKHYRGFDFANARKGEGKNEKRNDERKE